MGNNETPDLSRIAAVMLMPEQVAHQEITDQNLTDFIDGKYEEGSEMHTKVLVALAEDPVLRQVWQGSLKTPPLTPNAPEPSPQ